MILKMELQEFKKLAKKNLNQDLIVERMPGNPLLIYYPAIVVMREMAKIDYDWEFFYLLIKNGHLTIIYPTNRQIDIANRIFYHELEHPGFYQKYIDEWREINKKFNSYCEKLSKLDFTKFSLNEIKKLFEEFTKLFREVWVLPLTVTALAYYADNVLIPNLTKKYGMDAIVDYTTLSTPTQFSFLKNEEHKLIDIKKEILNKNIDLNKTTLDNLRNSDFDIYLKIEQHAKKYFFIKNNYRDGIILGENYFFDNLKDIEVKDYKKEAEEFRLKQANILSNNRFDKNELIFAKLIRLGTIFQDSRKRNNLLGNHYVFKFIEAMSNKTDYDQGELSYTTLPELFEILGGSGPTKNELQKRKSLFINYIDLKRDIVYSGEEIKDIWNEIETVDKPNENLNEVKGICASIGTATGKARIIMDANNYGEFNSGDILIASMTRPEYTPLMRKAGAIVTDEGGITCHAAIISRELGIPCVIGTKISTQIFKDGENITVDANNGIIKKND